MKLKEKEEKMIVKAMSASKEKKQEQKYQFISDDEIMKICNRTFEKVLCR